MALTAADVSTKGKLRKYHKKDSLVSVEGFKAFMATGGSIFGDKDKGGLEAFKEKEVPISKDRSNSVWLFSWYLCRSDMVLLFCFG
jgi:hypothetical protein